jgi:hypothetical protein
MAKKKKPSIADKTVRELIDSPNRMFYGETLRKAALERGIEFSSVTPMNTIVERLEAHLKKGG